MAAEDSGAPQKPRCLSTNHAAHLKGLLAVGAGGRLLPPGVHLAHHEPDEVLPVRLPRRRQPLQPQVQNCQRLLMCMSMNDARRVAN